LFDLPNVSDGGPFSNNAFQVLRTIRHRSSQEAV
jgi:hypothetical protein